jgi:hypothetical protein
MSLDLDNLITETMSRDVPVTVWGLTPTIDNSFLESQPDGQWLSHYYPKRFSRPFTEYQKAFHNWGDTIEKDTRPRPRIECEPRGVGKSTSTRGLVVKLLAKNIKSYVLYVCATDNQAQKHFNAIRSMMESEKLLTDYPHLKPQAQKHRPNVNKNWSSERLVTQNGQVVEFISLLGNARGFTTEEGQRPDLIILDDIDDSKDSPHMVAKKLDLLKFSILPAKAENTLVIMPQNLIHRNSICQQIKDQRADILSDRIFVGAYPLMKWYEAEKVDLHDGTNAKRWTITAGDVFDEAISVEYCEQLLNEAGKDSFDRECQQDVFKVLDDKDFREWNEIFHLVTYSEFRNYWQQYKVPVWNASKDLPQIPSNWNVGLGMDWGTTQGHPSAVTAVARPNMNVPLNDCFFVFAEIILPKYPLATHEEVPLVSPGRLVLALNQTLTRWNVSEKQVKLRLMSHEASAALNTMAIDLKDELKVFFAKWIAKKGSGVPQIQNVLEIDYTKEHPFRKHPETDLPIQGCPRIFFIVSDDQGELISDNQGKVYVAQPVDADGFARARYEMPLYSSFNTGQNKIDDDFCDSFRGLMNIFGVSSAEITPSEQYELDKPEGLRLANIELLPDVLKERKLQDRNAHDALLNLHKPIESNEFRLARYGRMQESEPDEFDKMKVLNG